MTPRLLTVLLLRFNPPVVNKCSCSSNGTIVSDTVFRYIFFIYRGKRRHIRSSFVIVAFSLFSELQGILLSYFR